MNSSSSQEEIQRDIHLTEEDIPGASLGNRDPVNFKIAELRFWLQCRGARGLSKLKTKADYVRL